MNAGPAGKLYTADLLSLATELASFPLDDTFPFRAEERSRTCGSTITLGVSMGSDGRIARIGMRVSACAIGQASAAIMARHVGSVSTEEAAAMDISVTTWLAGEGAMPQWPGFEVLAPALEHKGRHTALTLPWKALSQALSKAAIRS